MTYDYHAPADAAVEEMLDQGATGLEYFENYLPRYTEVRTSLGLGRADMPDYLTLCAMYDAEREMDLARLQGVHDALVRVNIVVAAELQKQQAQLGALNAVWQGGAGEAAHALLASQLRRAEDDYVQSKTVEAALRSAVRGLREIVKAKAETVSRYWHPTEPDIYGVGRADIDTMIVKSWTYLQSQRGGVELSDGQKDEYRKAYEWIRDRFVFHVDNTVYGFEALCDSTQSAVRQLYSKLSEELSKLDTTRYPMPVDDAGVPTDRPGPGVASGTGSSESVPSLSVDRGRSAPPVSLQSAVGGVPSQSAVGGVPSQSAAAGVPSQFSAAADVPSQPDAGAPAQQPAGRVPGAGDGLAQISRLAGEMSPLVGGLVQPLEHGLGVLSGMIHQGVGDAVGKLDELTGHPGETPRAEFDVAGRHLTVEIGSGELKLDVSEPSGHGQEFAVRLDDHGIPVITAVEHNPPEPNQHESGAPQPEHHPPTPHAGEEKPEQQAPTKDRDPDSSPMAPRPDQPSPPPAAPDHPVPPPVVSSRDQPAAPPQVSDQPVQPPAASPPDNPKGSGATLAEAGPLPTADSGAALAGAGPLPASDGPTDSGASLAEAGPLSPARRRAESDRV
ncbi:hypothetical protein [Nocardia transvalensis]|uniref:hypothetical protein n=1 Tax=Nocardia transvalensis TaxID=37333 RepID=UPI00189426A0|nr:hypothetical protein [Nocardia transvalensis]MBF6327450.1 hypothetical protein [Nocardia transvalensis]